MRYSKEEVIQFVEEEDVKFIRLAFCDVFGRQKNISIMPDELERILAANGVRDISLAGPGAFARTIPNEILVKIMNDPVQKKEFLDFCYRYDRNPYVCGMGKDNLFARGEIA